MLTFLSLVARLPLPLLHAAGSLFGLLSLLKPSHRNLIADNLRGANLYTPLRLLRVGMELGKMLTELPAVWLRPLDQAVKLVREVRGWEHIEAAKEKGKGIIFLGPHLGCWELAGLYVTSRMPVYALYRRPRQHWFHEVMQHGRTRGFGHIVEPSMSGVRTLFKALKQNDIALMLPDQHANQGEGIWAPILGRWAYMPTLSYRLYEKTHAPMLLFICERLPWGRGFRLNIEPLPELPEEIDASCRIVNKAIDGWVGRYPEQYLWSYRLHRFGGDKMPPEGPPV